MPSDKQVDYALVLLGEAGFSTTYMDSRFKELGATMRQRTGKVENWLRGMNSAAISRLISNLKSGDYAVARSRHEKPLAFICHDSRDKDDLVRALATELCKIRCPVWYDEYSLEVGDSLRATIEHGIKEARKCILVLSRSFFSNNGWGKAEFDSIFSREILEQANVILPIWHNVNADEVYAYSPRLVDRVALDSSIGVAEMAQKLSRALRG